MTSFLKLILCGSSVCVFVCVCVCPCPRLLITSGVMWCDMDLIRLVLQLIYGNCSPLMGMALALVRVIDTNPLRVSQHCIRC